MQPIPATYVNRFYALLTGDGVAKLTFGEVAEGGDVFHTAVAMSLADAEAFHNMLGGLIAQHKAKHSVEAVGDNVKPIR